MNRIWRQVCAAINPVSTAAARWWCHSARTDDQLRHLARLLRRYKDVQAAAGFLDQYKDVSLRTPRR